MTVIYLHHNGAKGLLDHRKTQHFTYNPDDPMQSIKVLGLNLGNTSSDLQLFVCICALLFPHFTSLQKKKKKVMRLCNCFNQLHWHYVACSRFTRSHLLH